MGGEAKNQLWLIEGATLIHVIKSQVKRTDYGSDLSSQVNRNSYLHVYSGASKTS